MALQPQPGFELCHHVGQRHGGGGGIAPVLVFDQALFQASVAQHHAVGYANQLPIGKHGPWALAPVIQNHIHAQRQQVGIEFFGGLFDQFAAVHANGAAPPR